MIHPTDIIIGAQIRFRRNEMKKSQTWLAEELHITFQQVQKYEKGTNRVSASRLFEIAQILEVQIGYFFGDVERVEKRA